MTLLPQVGTQLNDNLENFNTIALAWTSKPIADFDSELPAALYYLSALRSEASPYNTAVIQPSDHEVVVLVVCAVSALEDLLAELDAALVGFEPTGGSYEAFEHVAGDALDINQSIIWWRQVYAARNYQE